MEKIMPLKGEKYRHFKSKGGDDHTYEIIGIALNTINEEEVIIYKPLYDCEHELFVRPTISFLEKVEWQGEIVSRFTKI